MGGRTDLQAPGGGTRALTALVRPQETHGTLSVWTGLGEGPHVSSSSPVRSVRPPPSGTWCRPDLRSTLLA